MRTYELVLVLKSGLTESQQKKVVDTLKTWLKAVKVVKEDNLGKKQLSYPIKRETSGIYLGYLLEVETIPADLEKRILGQDGILRHLLVRKK